MTSTIYYLLALLSVAGRTTQHFHGNYPTIYGSYPTHQEILSTPHRIYPTPYVIYPMPYGFYPTRYGIHHKYQDLGQTCVIPPTKYVEKPTEIYLEGNALIEIPGFAILTIREPIPYLQTSQAPDSTIHSTSESSTTINVEIDPDVLAPDFSTSHSASTTQINYISGVDEVPYEEASDLSTHISQPGSTTTINVDIDPNDLAPDDLASHSASTSQINFISGVDEVPNEVDSDLSTHISQPGSTIKINVDIDPNDLAPDDLASHSASTTQINYIGGVDEVPDEVDSDLTTYISQPESTATIDVINPESSAPDFSNTQGAAHSESAATSGELEVPETITLNLSINNGTSLTQLVAANEVAGNTDEKTPNISFTQKVVEVDPDVLKAEFITAPGTASETLANNSEVDLIGMFPTHPTSNTLIDALANAATNAITGTLDSAAAAGNTGINVLQGASNTFNEIEIDPDDITTDFVTAPGTATEELAINSESLLGTIPTRSNSNTLIDTLANAATNLVTGTINSADAVGNAGVNVVQGATDTLASAFGALGK